MAGGETSRANGRLGGRKKGSKNRSTIVGRKLAALALNGKTKMPLDILMAAINGEQVNGKDITPMQLQAAAIAAPYVHPKLMAIRVDSTTGPNGELLAVAATIGQADPVEAAKLYMKIIEGKALQSPLLEHETDPVDVENLAL